MALKEEGVVFDCEGDVLCGVLHRGSPDLDMGVVVIVGGRQYRVGAHRQFVELGRYLSLHGFSVLRFDVRGMGDSGGDQRDYLEIDEDISAAISCLMNRVPTVKRVLLWGLCDGATAAVLHTLSDKRIAGLILVNPWVTTESGQAKTFVRHYYARRFKEGAFWRSLLSGNIQFRRSCQAFMQTITQAHLGSLKVAEVEETLPDLVFRTLSWLSIDVLIVLSSDDLTAREFDDEYKSRLHTDKKHASRNVKIERVQADHTFSSPCAQDLLFSLSLATAGVASATTEANQSNSSNGGG